MGIDIPIGLVFLIEVIQRQEKDEMLDHIGMVAGMEGVAVAEHKRSSEKGKMDYIGKRNDNKTIRKIRCNCT